MPRMHLPDGSVHLVKPQWAGERPELTSLLVDALVLTRWAGRCRSRKWPPRVGKLSYFLVQPLRKPYVDVAAA